MKDCDLWEEPQAGEEREGEGMAEVKCHGLTTAPIPHPLVLNGEDEIEELGMKLSLGRREEWREGGFIFAYLSLSYTVVCNKSSSS